MEGAQAAQAAVTSEQAPAPDGTKLHTGLLTGYTVIYGGSFDPPHLCHQMTCLYLLEGLAALEVWVVPTYVHPFGKQGQSYAHRSAMCALMLTGFGERAQVCDVERSLDKGGRTYYTLEYLQQHYPERKFALAVGADIMGSVARWYRFAAIAAMVPVVVVGRQGYPTYESPLSLPAISSSEVRERIAQRASLLGLVPDRIGQYIAQHQLYQA